MRRLKKLLEGLSFDMDARWKGVAAGAVAFVALVLLLSLAFRMAAYRPMEEATTATAVQRKTADVRASVSPAAPMPEITSTPTAATTPTFTPTPTSTPTPRANKKPATPASYRGWILFVSDRETDFFGSPTVWMVNPDTLEWRRAPAELAGKYEMLREQYAWSPDHSHKAYVNPDLHLWIHFPQGGGSWPLYRPGSGAAYDPQWSPAGDWIVFVCTEAGWDQIQLIRPDGSERRILFDPGPGMWAKHPSWSPDGKRIVFWSNIETGRKQLFVINLDGSGLRRLKSEYNDWDPLWLRD